MQKIATKVFIYSSIVFGALGLLLVLTIPGPNTPDDAPGINMIIMRLLMATGFVVLSSFALSVAGKYLKGKS